MSDVVGLSLIADVTALTERAAGRAEVTGDEHRAVVAAFRRQLAEAGFASTHLFARGQTDSIAELLGHRVVPFDEPMTWRVVTEFADSASLDSHVMFIEASSLWLGRELLDLVRTEAVSGDIVAVRTQPGAQAVVLPSDQLNSIPSGTGRVHDNVKAKHNQRVAGFRFVDHQEISLAKHGYLGVDYPEGWRYFAKAAEVGVGEYKVGPTEENAFWVLNHHHMKRMLGRVDTFCGLAGQRVLEIGASVRNSRPAEMLLDEFDVRSYTGLNISPFAYELSSRRGRLVESDIHDVDFDAESFDVIFSIAVWEHIPDPVPVLSKIGDWLAPGGFHYGTFLGFNGPKGHHIYGGPVARHVPDWVHLTHSADELREILAAKAPDASTDDIESTVDLVYHDDRINRVSAADFYAGLNSCGLEVLYLDGRNGGKVLRGASTAAERAGLSAEELSVQGFEFVLRKSEFSLSVLEGAAQSTGSPTT